MEEERKWEELNRDCLVEIFARVGIESLSQYIPFVCKSWYHATIVPKCWEILVFPFPPDDFYSFEFMKSVVDRSQGTATHIEFPCGCPKEGLVYISDKCPALKTLYLLYDECSLTSDLICKWKKLEFLSFSGTMKNLKLILESISLHCMNFVGLDCFDSHIGETVSSAIVEFIPKIKYLNLKSSRLLKKNLVKILDGCRELVSLDVRFCDGFDSDDSEILELASHIPSFKCNGSSLYYDMEPEDDYNDYYDRLDDDYSIDDLDNSYYYNDNDIPDRYLDYGSYYHYSP